MKGLESMNAQSSMAQTARTMQTKKRIKWQEINWKAAESYVSRLQIRIVKAVQSGKWRLVKRIQKLMCNSFYAKVLAVRRVVTIEKVQKESDGEAKPDDKESPSVTTGSTDSQTK